MALFHKPVAALARQALGPQACWLRSRTDFSCHGNWYFEDSGWQARLESARVIYFGERHEQPAIRDAQVAVLRRLARGGPAALVLEMFTLPQQPLLQRWRTISHAERSTEYDASGGDFNFEHYAHVVDAALDAGVSVWAGFPTREASREICSMPPTASQVEELGDVHSILQNSGVADHFRLFAAMITGEDMLPFDNDGPLPDRGKRIFPAQCWKDLVCAKAVASLAQTHRVMVCAGCGHTDYGLGVPQRVEALADASSTTDVIQKKATSKVAGPWSQCIITSREIGEGFLPVFRNRQVADLLVRYHPIDPWG
eukprot:TRINITY_DN62956_c0_g1_i1.p1 TRINITY_DN62956_c0_g1~~TRINITY_DN62956_c0_g1_i1.p1  ORF type:complete len:312 (+),score=42.34 TRINITY_DN62956_c0_g1_i1:127-1062(+)